MGSCCAKASKNQNTEEEEEEQAPERLDLHHHGIICKTQSKIYADIQSVYTLRHVIGHGAFGNVRLAHLIEKPMQEFAIKSILKAKLIGELFVLKRELKIIMGVDHPNIIKFMDVYEDDKYIHIVMEYCSGGELFDQIIERGHFTEAQAASTMYKLFQAVNHLHKSGICHRDLKPQNIIFASRDPDAELKIIDFGLASKFGETDLMVTVVGTPYYTAPEVLQRKYGPECDVWSLGIIMYFLLVGNPPYQAESATDIHRQILEQQISYEGDVWDNISSEAKQLLRAILVKDRKARITCEEALQYRWFYINDDQNNTLQKKTLKRLQRYNRGSQFKTQAMQILTKHVSQATLKNLTQMFRALDKDNSGYISPKELQRGLKKFGINSASEEINRIIHNTDIMGNGQINYTEFLIATMDRKELEDEENLWTAFKYFDVDNTGLISRENIREAFKQAGRTADDQEIEQIMSDMNIIDSEHITFEDFKKFMQQGEEIEASSSQFQFGAIENGAISRVQQYISVQV